MKRLKIGIEEQEHQVHIWNDSIDFLGKLSDEQLKYVTETFGKTGSKQYNGDAIIGLTYIKE